MFAALLMLILMTLIHRGAPCSGGYGLQLEEIVVVDTRIVTNPTFSWTMNPPVAWTYPDSNAFQTLSYLPGQSMTQAQAQNTANGDIQAAAIEALAGAEITALGVSARVTYSPPLVNDCIKQATSSGTTQTQTAIGEQFGYEEQGVVTYLASSSVAITAAVCASRSFGTTNPLTLTSFIQSASVQLNGVTASVFQLNQVATKMMSILNFNYNVKFVTEITLS